MLGMFRFSRVSLSSVIAFTRNVEALVFSPDGSGVCAPLSSWTRAQTGLPAEFKHISERRSKN